MITEVPNKILDKKLKKVDKFDREIKDIIYKMFKVKEEKQGIGLAANQIGLDMRLAVIGYTPEKDEDPSVPKVAIINPRVIWKSKNIDVDNEGCLSIPDVRVDVPRHKKIHIEYYDETGNRKKMKAKGIVARVIQHELDHLNGKKITDYK